MTFALRKGDRDRIEAGCAAIRVKRDCAIRKLPDQRDSVLRGADEQVIKGSLSGGSWNELIICKTERSGKIAPSAPFIRGLPWNQGIKCELREFPLARPALEFLGT